MEKNNRSTGARCWQGMQRIVDNVCSANLNTCTAQEAQPACARQTCTACNTCAYKEEDKTEEKEELKPLDEHAQILGAKDTGYDHDKFDEINKMATGEVKLIAKENKAGYILVVKKDIKADPYYRENLDVEVRHLLKDKEFNKDMAEIFKTAKADVNSFAVDRFKVKKIKEPTY